ncbi:MAG: tetratricopeptide repeat protein [Spirochaetaceae bacterium]|nr:tetratricopeptide repeat protein [Spirochaetaceae bacterium]
MAGLLRRTLAFTALGLVLSGALGAQDRGLDLNTYYHYPFSIGGQYQSLSPFGNYRSAFDLYDLAAVLRYPLPRLPTLQPSLQAGVIQFSPRGDDKAWEHKDAYALLGAAYSNRFSKTFELGADLSLGASLSLYPKLFPETGTVGNYNFLAQAGGRLALIPSYNFAIELSPSLKYLKSLGAVADFDGLILGVGLSFQMRLGEDPDAPKAALRSLRLGDAGSTAVFPAMQSWYVKNPFAKIQVTNTESFPVSNVELSFFQKGYMDSPTLCARIPELKAGESREVGILASFNAEVFKNEGQTPLSGEVVVTYSGRGRAGEQRATLAYDLQDKSAIVWDDDRKAAAFVTPADGALRNYASYVRQINKDQIQPGYSEAVQFACQVFHALGEIGILYQVDPTQPFASARGGKVSVDSVSLPRQTLKRITGDCDDLTVLYASLLESAGIDTALVTVPGHIYAAFATKTAGRAFGDLHPDRSMTINVDDELWIPVEITMIGKSGFVDAWRKGVEEWRAAEADPSSRGFYPIRKAQELYRPVGLKETDLGLQYGRKEPVVANAVRDVGKLVDAVADAAQAQAKATGSKEDQNRLGIKLARFGRYEKAAAAFRQAAALDPSFASPRLNLGNVYFLSKDYAKALAEYQKLDRTLSNGGAATTLASLRLNISKCYNALGDYAKAGEFLAKATELDPSLGEKFAYLAAAEGSGSRAGDATADRGPVFEE